MEAASACGISLEDGFVELEGSVSSLPIEPQVEFMRRGKAGVRTWTYLEDDRIVQAIRLLYLRQLRNSKGRPLVKVNLLRRRPPGTDLLWGCEGQEEVGKGLQGKA